MLIFNGFYIHLQSFFILFLYLTWIHSIVYGLLQVNGDKNETVTTMTTTTTHSNSTNDNISNTSTITNTTSSTRKVIQGASFTMTDSSYYDYKPNSMNYNEGYKTKTNEHYDKHKVNYEQYFKNYDQSYHHKHKHHHHHHHHHDHHDHYRRQDQDQNQDHHDHNDHHHSYEYSSKEDNHLKTISSEWIYDKLKEYLTCIYEKQMNCEDQFVTELQLKLLKIQSNKQKINQHYESISSDNMKQIPILSVNIDTETLVTKHDDDHSHKEHQHKKEHEEIRKDLSTIYRTNNDQVEINRHKEIEQTEKFYSHESYQSLDNDKHLSYYHNDHHDRHHHNPRHHHYHHHQQQQQHQHQHHHHPPPPPPPPDHHRHKDHHDHDRDHRDHHHHHRSSSHNKYGWFEKLDKMIPSLDDNDDDDDEEEKDEDEDDEHRHKHKDKHPHHRPTYRKYSNKY
ncbi:unnamed protein product [Schistosoma spindalis]|nr:unnamed protein product [Schistosoma spindale]